MKPFILALIVLGEVLFIYAEEFGAKRYRASGDFTHSFVLTLLPLAVGAVFLVVGYMLGLKHFHNIWVITAFSIGAILLTEPLFDFYYIGQVPTLGAGLGFVFGALGMLSTLFL